MCVFQFDKLRNVRYIIEIARLQYAIFEENKGYGQKENAP